MPNKPFKFIPKPGQTDFTKIRWAPVINCVLKYKGKILIVERDKKMKLYPGYWNGVSGFLDDGKGLEEKIYEEMKEELGLSKKNVVSFKLGEIFDQDEKKYKKTWIVHPVLVTVNTDKVKLDWEAKRHAWIDFKDIKKYKLLPGFDKVLNILFK